LRKPFCENKASAHSALLEDTFQFGRGKFFAHQFLSGLSLDPKTPGILAEKLAKII